MRDTEDSFKPVKARRVELEPETLLRALAEPFEQGARVWLLSSRIGEPKDWTGRSYAPTKLPDFDPELNWWFSTACFPGSATSRALKQMTGIAAIVIDDPTTKGDAALLFAALGEPSYKIQTSRHSQHWGYLLREPATAEQAAPVYARIATWELGDKSGNNAVRYVRLPCGVNNKKEHGESFGVHCVAWNPERRFTIDDIAKALEAGAPVTVARVTGGGGESDQELKRLIRSGESLHGPLTKLAFRAVMRGEHVSDVIFALQALMMKSEARDSDTQRWSDRYAKIESDVLEVLDKFPEARVKQLLRRDTKKAAIADEENVWRIFEQDADLHGLVRYDAFMCQRVVSRPIPGDERVVADREYPRPWRDDDTVSVQRYVQRKYIVRIAREKVDAVIGEWAVKRWPFHPIRDYLNKLKWDGRPRIDRWLHVYMGADNAPQAYVQAIGAKWLIAAVARIFEPGCKVDTMLVLEGPQGAKKSTAMRVLAGPENFSDSMPADLSGKDARDHIRGKWICEMSELAQFRKSEIESVKAFLSRQVEQFRPAYGRAEIVYPRQCVFAGSTNASEYLVDDTGNRRFWVVPCRNVDLKALQRDRDQLWAEAADRYLIGEDWWLSPDMENIAAEQADARRMHDPWQDEIAALLDEDRDLKKLDQVKPTQVLSKMDLTASQRTPIYAARVAKILKELKWRKPSHSARFFLRPKTSKVDK